MSEPLLNSRDTIRLRPFQDKDGERVREIYLKAMLTGASSPTYMALKAQLTRPWALYFYAQMVFGAVLVLRAPTVAVRLGGGILVVSALGLLYAWRRNTRKVFETFTGMAVTGDLADVLKHYSAPGSGFWVAEITNGKDTGKVVGCVGLDSSASPEPGTAELRRMAVLPELQGHGVGTRLLSTLIIHAREKNLTTITLNTSMYQVAAMNMYEAAGFKEVQRVLRTVKFLFISSSATVHFFSMTL
ncbi:hypothetical protein D9619_008310 [Psilocybe cf. subviscida]|uniref:N-acetyltransferase domain-containing protein n=1 Tax=Psilocybe cf. subviscida TaxID=2480587 RepID=A0A8H5B9L7_9AGAR|nr:hypothetical protein D9619_008304 [Psilocybe cf. subviscida]KAF5319552.1 hypothetical protein D9619_008310 [Psilocybe cf. subviscida]